MSTSSIDGLISGLNTTQIIDQLMQLNAQPQTLLKNRVSEEQTRVSSLQTVNAKFAAVATKAANLSSMSSWSPSTATSDNDNVTVTADAGATAGTLSFDIQSVATAYRATYTTTAALGDTVMAAGDAYTINFNDGRSSVDINTGDGSLQLIANALNDPKTGLHAALVRSGTNTSGDPTYSLAVSDATTGAKSDFTIDETDPADPAAPVAFLGGMSSSTAGSDASILVAGQATPLTSSSNTFADLMPGVDVTLGAQASGSAVVTITRDTTSLTGMVQDLVDSANAALDDISSLTAYNPDTQTGGLLTGDSTLRTLRDQLLSAVTTGVNGQSLASVGIEVDKTGKITFDADKFQTAYEADPTGTAEMFAGSTTWSDPSTDVQLQSATWRTQPGSYSVVADASGGTIDGQAGTLSGALLTGASNSPVDGLTLQYAGSVNGTITYTQGIAAKLEALAQQASNSTDGTVTMEIQGKNSSIDGMNNDIADWDVRLAQQRTTLEAQYSQLEVSLGKLKDQGTWLSGQIASLPSISTGSSGG